MKRLFWRVFRIALGLLAVLIAAVVALLIYTRGDALLLIALLIQPLVSNTHPPPIAEDLFPADWSHDVASRNFSTLLQRRFPVGSSEGTLVSTLLNQGFKPLQLAPNQSRCLPIYAARPDPDDGITRSECDAYDPSKTYKYSFSEGICGSNVTVWWTTDDRGSLVRVMGAFQSVC
jgi:hypothetical protein